MDKTLNKLCHLDTKGVGMLFRRKKTEGEKITVKCEQCGEEFTMLKSTFKAREKKNKVRFCSKKCSSKFRSKKTEKECKHCGKKFITLRNEFCSKKCVIDFKNENGIFKKNGFWFENGYKVLYTENGNGIKEHIKIMEDYIGRKLKKNECVHHKNLDRLDNRIENLQLMTIGEHSSLHRKLELKNGKKLFGDSND